jgi:Ca2+-binding EF-hand superfamily protein
MLAVLALTPLAVATQGPGRGRGGPAGGDAWKLIAERYDADANDEVSAEEYPRGADRFANLDRNKDGVLTSADFGGRRPRDMSKRVIGHLLGLGDVDENGEVSAEEWSLFLEALGADEDGVIPADAMVSWMPRRGGRRGGRQGGGGTPPMATMLDRNDDGVVGLDDLNAIFEEADVDANGKLTKSELAARGARAGLPQRGDPAPDFELAFASDPTKTVKLSSFVRDKPVALVFGSYT